MDKVQLLKRREETISELDELKKLTRGNEKRELTADELAKVVELDEQLEKIDEDLEMLQKAARALEKDIKDVPAILKGYNKEGEEGERAAIRKRYSITSAIRSLSRGQEPKGVEGEMHKVALEEAQRSGFNITGVGIPNMISTPEKRAEVEVATAASAGNLVETTLAPLVPSLVPNFLIQKAGATMMTGLVGNVDIPVHTTNPEPGATGEKGTTTEMIPATVLRSLSPKRYGGTIPVTAQMIAQSSVDMDLFISNALVTGEAIKVDKDVILGGGSNEIEGILTLLTAVGIGANGGNLTRELLLNLEELIDDANAVNERRVILTTNAVKRFARNLKVDTGSGKFLYEDGQMIDYEVLTSTNVPGNLTKGSSGAVCSALILGNFSRLVLANWGTKDLIYDPYTRKKEGIAEVTMNSFYDMVITHEDAFQAYNDITTA